MTQEGLLYTITGIMILFSLAFIFHVISVSRLKTYVKEKDSYYMQRIDGLEAIIRTEFKAVLESLKKI